MTALREILKEADPLRVEPPLDPADAQRMRRAVVRAAREGGSAPTSWRSHVLVAVMTMLMISAVVTLARRPAAGAGEMAGWSPPLDDLAVTPARQMQFSTPGGTRVIWVFNPDFEQ